MEKAIALSEPQEHEIEWVMPADSADYEPRPVHYSSAPLLLPDGTSMDLNKLTGSSPAPPRRQRSATRRPRRPPRR